MTSPKPAKIAGHLWPSRAEPLHRSAGAFFMGIEHTHVYDDIYIYNIPREPKPEKIWDIEKTHITSIYHPLI